jgi:pSer/pThr/pTyr-binding forkhead associated (FHA) protein
VLKTAFLRGYPKMQVVLVMFKPDGERRSFSVARDVTVIGRREDCDLRIPLGDISRKHCRLIKDGNVLKLEDLGSSNGTYRNGERIQETELSPGDTIQLGPIAFVVQIEGVPEEDQMQPMLRGAAPAQADEEAEVLEEVQLEEETEGEPQTAQAARPATPDGEFDPMAFLNSSSDSGTMDALGDGPIINEEMEANPDDEIVNLEEDADSRHDSAV